MVSLSLLVRLAPFAQHLHKDWTAWRDRQRLRDDLERLLSAGDHLLEDIGLDPGSVRQALKEPGESWLEGGRSADVSGQERAVGRSLRPSSNLRCDLAC